MIDQFCTKWYSRKSIKNNSDLYAIGLELEFYCCNDYYNEIKNAINKSDNPYSKSKNIFGLDGAGFPTGEFRSPIFVGKNPEKVVNKLLNFVQQDQSYLLNNFKVAFLPYTKFVGECPHTFGLHFTISNKFLNPEIFFEILERCITIQPLLEQRVEDKNGYELRSHHYSGKIFANKERCDSHNAIVPKYSKMNCDEYSPWPTRYNLVEFRFFPSGDISTLAPYIKYCLLGGEISTNTIKNISSLDK